MNDSPRHVVILGGGLAGLTAAYYMNKQFGASVKLTILDSGKAFGGWCQTMPQAQDSWFECGPRSFRGSNGVDTLKIVHEIGLENDLLLADKRLATSRFVLLQGKLVKLGPFAALRQIGFRNLLSEPFVPRRLHSEDDDESVYAFAERRFGTGLATLFSAMLTGIYAGDATKLSIQSVFPMLSQLEDCYGSVILGAICKALGLLPGALLGLFKRPFQKEKLSPADVFAKKMKRKSVVFTFKGGMGQLPQRLAEKLDAEKLLNCKAKSLEITGPSPDFAKSPVTVKFLDEQSTVKEIRADHVISALPAHALVDVLKCSVLHSAAVGTNPSQALAQCTSLLQSIPFSSVAVVGFGLQAEKCPWPKALDGFGYLAPPSEGADILGTLMESSTFPGAQPESLTRITVMIGKEDHLKQSQEHLVEVAQQSLEQYLGLCFRKGQSTAGVTFSPLWVATVVQRNCIPQFVLGHKKRVKDLQATIAASLPQLTLVGQSYEGVGINDTIRMSKEVVEGLKQKWSHGK